MTRMLGWCFTGPDFVDGKTRSRHGTALSAYRDPLDGLAESEGNVLRRVRCNGEVVRADSVPNSLSCSAFVTLWSVDATDLLCRFAALCAMDAVELCGDPVGEVRNLRVTPDATQDSKTDFAWLCACAARDAAKDGARSTFRDSVYWCTREADPRPVASAAWYTAWAVLDAFAPCVRDYAWVLDEASTAAQVRAWRRMSSRLLRLIHKERRKIG